MPNEDGTPTAEELAATAAAEEAGKTATITMTRQELDEMLAERDQRLLTATQQGMAQVLSQMQQNQPQKRDEPTAEQVAAEAERAQAQLNISPEEFWRNPQEAMAKFYEAKVAPLVKQRTAQAPDMTGLTALAETRIQGLWNSLSEQDKKLYGPYLSEVVKKTDPRILADTKGIDSVWRLTKSYADDHIRDQETQRSERNQRANLHSGQGNPPEVKSKIELSADETEIAFRMGLSPELYKQYGEITEVEPGGLRK